MEEPMESPSERLCEELMHDPVWLSITSILIYYLLVVSYNMKQNHKNNSLTAFWIEVKEQGLNMVLSLVLSIFILGLDDKLVLLVRDHVDDDFVWPWYLYTFGGIWPQIGWQIVGKNGLIAWIMEKWQKKAKNLVS
ncbi:MAG: hypothetical protein JSW41_01955 [Candidatus Aenigmatarchaeota archaeon]|nr:MAG: hypothetical protein JSW41_01955 [Candidatus Aenigmarchaeota archaeon]